MASVYQQISMQQVAGLLAYLEDLEANTTPAAILSKLLTVDGASSGLDADLLDGLHASSFVLNSTYTASDILSKLITVDGTGSSLDADLLDGYHASAFALSSATYVNSFNGRTGVVTLTSGDVTTALGYTPWHAGNDGAASGLDADLLDGLHANSFVSNSATQSVGGVKTWSANAVFSANVNVTNRVTANAFSGNGALVTSVNALALEGFNANAFVSNTADQTVGGVKTWTANAAFGNSSYVTIGSGLIRPWTSADTDIDGLIPGTTSGLLFEGRVAGHFVVGLRSNDSTDGFHVIDKGNATDGILDPYVNQIFTASRVAFTYQGNTIWHTGNDGAGSTLDADLLDGSHANAFVSNTDNQTVGGIKTWSANAVFSANVSVANNITVGGGLTATGAVISNTYVWVNRTSAASYVYVQASAGFARGIFLRTGSSPRWLLSALSSAESGSDVGSEFRLASYADDGTTSTNIITAYRNSANVLFHATPYIGGPANTVWHAGNDGSGSGLDADLLDGYESSAFPRKAEDATVGGNWTFSGNVTFGGTTTIVNATNLDVYDAIITVAANNSSGSVSYSGMKFERGSAGNDAYLVWNETSDVFQFGTATDDTMASFARGTLLLSRLDLNVPTGTAPMIVTSTTLVANLNSDLLDGQEGSYYRSWANFTGTPTTLSGYGITDAISNTATQSVDGVKTWTANGVFSANVNVTNRVTANLFSGNGALLTTVNASALGSGTVPAARMPAFTGDATSVSGAVALTLATVNPNVGAWGNATHVGTLTINGKGLTTAAAATLITPAWGSLTGTPTTLSGYGITDAVSNTNTQTVGGVKTWSANAIFSANVNVTNGVTANAFSGNGALVTSVNADLLDGSHANAFVSNTDTQTVAGIKTWSNNATFSANVTIGTGHIHPWTSAHTDIDGLIPGTTSGLLFEGPVNSHFVVGIRSNNQTDGFYVIDKGDAVDSGSDPYLNLILAVNRTTFTYQGNTIWHAGNDGAASGLDADLLDGSHANAFVSNTDTQSVGGVKTWSANAVFSANVNVTDRVTANTFSGNGALITSVNATALGGFNAAYFANSTHAHAFASITSTPTTLAGYGITDAVSNTATQSVAGVKTWTANGVFSANVDVTNRVTANAFAGNGALLTTTNAAALTGIVPNASLSGTYDGVSIKLGSGNTIFGVTSTHANARTVYDLVQYRSSSTSSAATGAIVFHAPTTSGSIMIQMSVKGLWYASGQMVDFTVQGYRTTGAWSNSKVRHHGDKRPEVRWGYDETGKTVLIVGDVGTVWSYPQLTVYFAMFSHTNASDAFCTGWTATLETDISAYTNVSADLTLTDASYAANAGTANNSTNFAGQAQAWYANSTHVHTFASITSTPTTLAGYGITDAVSNTASQTVGGVKTWSANAIFSANVNVTNRVTANAFSGNGALVTSVDAATLGGQAQAWYANSTHVHAWSSLTGTPTSLAGYGITDAVSNTAAQSVGGAKTFEANVAISVGANNNYLSLRADAGFAKIVSFQTGSSWRWAMGSNITPESGGNAGSDFALYRYNDTGIYVDTVLSATRSTGIVNFTYTPTVVGNTIWHAGNDGAASGLDADTVDGLHANAFISNTDTQSVAGVKTWTANAVFSANVNVTNRVTANAFSGNGALVTSVNALALEGFNANAFVSNTASQTVGGVKTWSANAVFSANVSVSNNISAGGLVTATSAVTSNTYMMVTSGAASAYSYLQSDAGQYRGIAFRTGTASRWQITVDNVAESGSSAGSNFGINSYNDAGTFLATPLSINRATGVVNFAAAPIMTGGTLWNSTNDGAASGLDADLLDGLHANSFVSNTDTQSVGGIKTWSANAIFSANVNVTNQLTANVVLAGEGTAAAPSLSWVAVPDAGFYANASTISIATGGARRLLINSAGIYSSTANGAYLLNETSNTSNPTLVPNRASTSTGIGGLSGSVSLIATATEILTANSTTLTATTPLTSSVAPGTAPLIVASNTVVANLNSGLLGGYDAASFPRKAENATIAGAWTFNGAPLFFNAAGMSIRIGGDAATNRGHQFETAASLRWWAGATETAESGSNVGTNYAIYRYSDAGAYVGNPLFINRATGVVTLETRPSWAGYTPWDSNNLVGPATLAGTQTFTGDKTFSNTITTGTWLQANGGTTPVSETSLTSWGGTGLYYHNIASALPGDSSPGWTLGTVLTVASSTIRGFQLGTQWNGGVLCFRTIHTSGTNGFLPWVKIWTESNDGAASGLDADLLDGLHANSFVSNTATQSVGGIKTWTANAVFSGANVALTGTTVNITANVVFAANTWISAGGSDRLYFSTSSNTEFKTADSFYFRNTSNTIIAALYGSTGTLSCVGDVIAGASDGKLKLNPRRIQDPLAMVDQINGYVFDWDMEKVAEAGYTPYMETEHGVIAQEVLKVMPDAVRTAAFGDGEYLTVKYEKLVPLLFEAIKAQQAQINELREMIDGST